MVATGKWINSDISITREGRKPGPEHDGRSLCPGCMTGKCGWWGQLSGF